MNGWILLANGLFLTAGIAIGIYYHKNVTYKKLANKLKPIPLGGMSREEYDTEEFIRKMHDVNGDDGRLKAYVTRTMRRARETFTSEPIALPGRTLTQARRQAVDATLIRPARLVNPKPEPVPVRRSNASRIKTLHPTGVFTGDLRAFRRPTPSVTEPSVVTSESMHRVKALLDERRPYSKR